MTTRILFCSDIHLEFGKLGRLPPPPNPDDYDAILLIGDIGIGNQGVLWAMDFFKGSKPVYYIPGNHEYYQRYYEDVCEKLLQYEDIFTNFHVLNPGIAIINDVKIIGATLWSSLEAANGYSVAHYVSNAIADFRVIHNGEGLWTTDKHIETHKKEVEFIDEALTELGPGKVVVATHFLPTADCTHPKYFGSHLNPYFANNLDWLCEKHRIDYWLFGHTHDVMDVVHASSTRMISNPFGYPNEFAFRPNNWAILEL